MGESGTQTIFLITSVIIVLLAFTMILLFTVFQRRKNSLLVEQEENKKRFEREIAETQIEIREETLRNISWELHDNIGQLLTLAKIQLQTASEENIADVRDTISKSLQEIRALSKLINPEAIKNIKLKDAIQLEVDRFNRLNFIESTLKIKGEEKKIDTKSSIVIFRILQEFFSNTIKHSKASTLCVEINYKKTELKIKAKDNGIGFNIDKITTKGIGLHNIKKRAELIGGNAKFETFINKGTTLTINYPYKL